MLNTDITPRVAAHCVMIDLQASYYLDVKPLVDMTCRAIADTIKGKSPEEIRNTFNIVNDFTPQEGARWFAELAAASSAEDAIIFIDVPPGSPDYMPLSDYSRWAMLEAAMRSDPRLHVSKTWEVPRNNVKITLWTPAPVLNR